MTNLPPQSADWQALNPVLERCYQGRPQGISGTFQGTVLTIAKLLNGDVRMEKDGYEVSTNATKNEWIICMPGTRTQHFSDDAEIYSIHFALGTPQNGAEWTGKPIICTPTHTHAENALSQLINCPVLQDLPQAQRLNLRALNVPLNDYLELKKYSFSLLQWALTFSRQSGMHYEVPRIQDTRVRTSHRNLASLEIYKEFDRNTFAAGVGLTAGQLDRLWRKELKTTPSRYRDRQRLTYACEQLRQHEIPIKIIAAELGFRHISQFSNWFNARHGESPRSYRKRPSTD
ncbi:helix-turn-helix domain-containing protein [Coraliomargarita sp. SDUM461004]|uniref:Helix-turn-helix domain-containing protein n=1 Tax=Thalassobacterium sedimentorum TaxID=3041258 RepID=A0ABU1AKG8_9BACT|nr:helix-turn-helix domain-containing protein [Coraliomargarita sp. SDUM461004]MDQ8194078.1 helix-turn-helix domain-containing protein [Coraliomargarita sp. SDUM461004]